MYDPLAPKKRKRLLSKADKNRIAANQGWNCKSCGNKLPARFHVDHIKPFSEGGSDRDSNLQALCGSCHDDKTEEDRHKRKQAKIRQQESRSGGLFGPGDVWGSKPKGRSKAPKPIFDLSSAPKRGKPKSTKYDEWKKKSIFDYGNKKRDGTKRKGFFDF